jgi:hypothetical protein
MATIRSVGLFFLALIATSHAFVAPKLSAVSRRQHRQHPLHLMDPSHHHFLTDVLSSSLSLIAAADDSVPAPGEVSYSKASYYTVLGLYVMSFPGLWSQIKRSTSAKLKRKTYIRYVDIAHVLDLFTRAVHQISSLQKHISQSG